MQNQTNFFSQLADQIGDGESVTLILRKSEERMSAIYSAKFGKKVRDIILDGTAEDFDETFLTDIQKPLEIAKGLKSNAEEIATEISGDDKKAAPKKASSSSSGSKKAAPKKAAAKPKSNTNPSPMAKAVAEQKKKEADAAKKIAEEARKKEAAAAKAKSEAEKKKAEEESKASAAQKEEDFKQLMAQGRDMFDGVIQPDKQHKYVESLNLYKAALALFPENAEAKKKVEVGQKWVEAIRNAGLIEEEGGTHGT